MAQGVPARQRPICTASDFIDSPGKARWYKVAITPGQRIQVVLSNLPADYDLAVFRTSPRRFANQFNPATAGINDLVKLAAEYAPSTFSPSTFSPSTFSPDAYTPSTFSPSTFSCRRCSRRRPSAHRRSVPRRSRHRPFSPSTFSPSTLQPVDVQSLDVLAVHLHRDRDSAGILDGARRRASSPSR